MRRGLFRTWIALSAAWSVGCLFVAQDTEWNSVQGAARPLGNSCHAFLFACQFAFWTDRIEQMLAPWMLTAAVLGVRWVIRGFRSPLGAEESKT
jgi:hypothetical protein